MRQAGVNMGVDVVAILRERGSDDAGEVDPLRHTVGHATADEAGGVVCSAGELRVVRSMLGRRRPTEWVEHALPSPGSEAVTTPDLATELLELLKADVAALNDAPVAVLLDAANDRVVHVDAPDNREPFVATTDRSQSLFLSSDGVSVLSGGNVALRSRYVFQEALPCGERAVWIDHDTGLSAVAPLVSTVPVAAVGDNVVPYVPVRLRAEMKPLPGEYWRPVVERIREMLRATVDSDGELLWSSMADR